MWNEAKNKFKEDKKGSEQWAEEKTLAYQQNRNIKKSASILKFFPTQRVQVNSTFFR